MNPPGSSCVTAIGADCAETCRNWDSHKLKVLQASLTTSTQPVSFLAAGSYGVHSRKITFQSATSHPLRLFPDDAQRHHTLTISNPLKWKLQPQPTFASTSDRLQILTDTAANLIPNTTVPGTHWRTDELKLQHTSRSTRPPRYHVQVTQRTPVDLDDLKLSFKSKSWSICLNNSSSAC